MRKKEKIHCHFRNGYSNSQHDRNDDYRIFVATNSTFGQDILTVWVIVHKKSLKIPQWQPESVSRGTDNTMATRKRKTG